MSAGLDRQIRPIYDALDSNSPKSAIVTCNKLLKKNPDHVLVKALKALALLRLQKIEECLAIVDVILPTKPVNDNVLTALMHSLRGLGRHLDVVSMFEAAYKQQPNNEDLAAQVFYAHLRTYNWKAAQQVATKMHKQFHETRYLFWSIMSAILQARSPSTEPSLRTLLFKLAHRMITSAPSPHVNADRFYLHLTILKELQLWDEADELLASDIGKLICVTSLVCQELRRQIWQERNMLQRDAEAAREKITKGDRNWLDFLSLIGATLSVDASQDVQESIASARKFLGGIAENDGTKDRSASLALLELERQAKSQGISTDEKRLEDLVQGYFSTFGDKACCFEDLKPVFVASMTTSQQLVRFLESQPLTSDEPRNLQKLINVLKLQRLCLKEAQLTPQQELERCNLYLQHYFSGLAIGADYPDTELQPADDLAILAGTTLVNVFTMTKDHQHLYNAVCILEYALTKSKQCFQARLMLIRIYRILGCASLALDHYRSLNIKQVQHDTLSHFLLSRGSTFSQGTLGDLTMLTECVEASQIYGSNQQETNEYISRAFQTEKYSQIPEFLLFEERLDRSLQRDLTRVEQARMRFASEVPTSEPIDLELIELKLILERGHHDNRDYNILPNYQPMDSPSLEQQTQMFAKTEHAGWLWAFISGYVKIYQGASDLDDIVEDKLLVGDRPKRDRDPAIDPCLRTTFTELNEDVLVQCTEEEGHFLRYVDSLADWLVPHHDHVRPPPAVVLAEAAKQTELRTGQPMKPFDLPENGANGKKEKEPPLVKDSPEGVNNYFASLHERFMGVVGDANPVMALHLASLAHEAFLLLYVHTQRFKSPTVVKVHKLGSLSQNCKTLRSTALKKLQEISQELLERSKSETNAHYQEVFQNAWDPLSGAKMDREFVLAKSRAVGDSRKKGFESLGKGLAKVHSTYNSLI